MTWDWWEKIVYLTILYTEEGCFRLESRGGGLGILRTQRHAQVVDSSSFTPWLPSSHSTYNPGQNYLRKFSPSCPFSYATKLFPKRRLCGKKTPSPNSMLLPTNAQGSGFLLNAQQHCFQGKGEREEPVQLRRLEKCCPSIQFSQQFCPRLCTR